MSRHAVRIENLHYTYPPAVTGMPLEPALQGLNLVVEAAECLAIMGPTGAGKTTLCLTLNGLVPQSTGGSFRGEVWVAGRNTKAYPVAELATEVGIVFQDSESQLFNMTIADEVAFGPESLGLPTEEIERHTQWALEVVGLADLQARSPAHLSGGQQRRLAIAAVLAMRPGILVLDEPTAGLDPLGRLAVLALIAELRSQGTTVVLATQDADALASLADRVVVLEAGHIGLEGTPQEVLGRVEHLHSLGVDVPQVTELSHCLGIHPPCLAIDQAVQALSRNDWHSPPAGQSAPFPGGHAPATPPADWPLERSSIIFEDAWYRYQPGVQALAGVDLVISPGECVALIGANGSGKTTLAKHVNGLLRPQQGRVLVAGRDTRRGSTGELARQISYVFQNPGYQIFAPTVWEEIAFGPRNLSLGRGEVERRVEMALTDFHLRPLADLPPATLGYGQRRLVTLAAVHAMQPQVLILDEPTVGLDRLLTGRLVEWMSGLHAAGATVLLITHDMRLASLTSRCMMMDKGQVILDAPTPELFTHLERLADAGIEPPPIVDLSNRLGLPTTPLTVGDFCQAFLRWVGERDAP